MRRDGQCMDVGLHHRPQGTEDRLVSLQASLALEVGRNDGHPEMAPAVAGSGVALVKVTLVIDFQHLWRELAFETGSDFFNSAGCHT